MLTAEQKKVRDEALGHLRAARDAVSRLAQFPARAITLAAIAEAIRYLERP